jgi:hypothetical protein
MYPHLTGGGDGDGSLGESGVDRARQVQMEGVARPDPRFEQSTPRPSHAPFDPSRYQGAAELDPAGFQEFGATAKELGLSHDVATRLLGMHTKVLSEQRDAFETQKNQWYRETEHHFGDRLPEVVDDIKTAIGSDADAVELYRLLEWSGMAYSPQVLRVLHRLSNGRRRW